MFPCSPSLFPYTTLFRSFAFLLLLDMLFYRGQDLSIERAIVLFCYLSYLFQQMSRKPNSKRFYVVFHVVILTLIWLHIKGLDPCAQAPNKERAFYPRGSSQGFYGAV